jgi:hemolysin D
MVYAPKREPDQISNGSPTTKTAHSWSSSLQTVLDQPPANLPLRVALGGTVFCLLFGAWAWFGQVDEVARASGKLIPKGEVYRVHPSTSGKVVRVAVKEGQTVKTGQVLMELDTELARNEVERLEQLLQSSKLELLQTQALLDKTRLQAETRQTIAQTGMQMHQVAIAQAQNNATNNRELLDQFQVDASAQAERLQRLKPLLTQGAIARENLFAAEQQMRDRQRSITEHQNTLQQTQAEANRLQIELQQKQADSRQSQLEAQQQIQQLGVKVTELQAKVQETQALLSAARAKLNQQSLNAPVDGVVTVLNTRRTGDYAQPEQVLAEITPKGKPLVLSAVLPSAEAGFVKVGMPVNIKLDAYPYQDYGIIPATVTSVSPDSKPDDKLGQVYRLEITLNYHSVKAQGQTIKLKAGQTAQAEILTRQRRIADVLLDPIKKLQSGLSL